MFNKPLMYRTLITKGSDDPDKAPSLKFFGFIPEHSSTSSEIRIIVKGERYGFNKNGKVVRLEDGEKTLVFKRENVKEII